MKELLFSRMSCNFCRFVTNTHLIVESDSNFISSKSVHKIHVHMYCNGTLVLCIGYEGAFNYVSIQAGIKGAVDEIKANIVYGCAALKYLVT
jgi:hypothetical protein